MSIAQGNTWMIEPMPMMQAQQWEAKQIDLVNQSTTSSRVWKLQADINCLPGTMFIVLQWGLVHADLVVNLQITNDKDMLFWYKEWLSNVTMANKSKAPAQWHGCALLIQFPGDSQGYPIWPVYYMSEKEWPTLSLPALWAYNAFQLASIHSLDSVEITDSWGWNKKFKMRIEEQVKYNLDFFQREYVRPKPRILDSPAP